MILVDTSVLIGYFKGLNNAPNEKMNYIADHEIPYGICHYVYQELLQVAANKQEYELLKDYLNTLPFYSLLYEKESFENAALMYIDCRKKGITVRSTIDILIAEIAIENDLYLFHNDNDYTNISKICKNLKIY
jgi:predicted nucleic acid-binding protein